MWWLGGGTVGNDPYSSPQKAKTKQPSGPLVKTCNLGPNSPGPTDQRAKNGANQQTGGQDQVRRMDI